MSSPELIELLCHGEITVKGRMPWSSNATFLTEVCSHDHLTLAVYKPARGERQLWDFPAGLGPREVAAYELSDALGWDIVPLTVLSASEITLTVSPSPEVASALSPSGVTATP